MPGFGEPRPRIMIMSLASDRAHSFYSSEHLQIFNAWAKRLQADYSLRTLSNFISKRGEHCRSANP